MTRQKIPRDLDVYFASKRFRKRLNKIRKLDKDPSERKIYAFDIVTKMGLKLEHVTVIHHYLMTGHYNSDTAKSNVRLISKDTADEQGSSSTVDADNIGVFLEIPEDTTRDELLQFIEDNWSEIIKPALDSHYPDRIKRFMATLRIDNYLAIADAMNKCPSGHEKSMLSVELGEKYKIDTRTIYEIAQKYKSILTD